MDQCSKTTGMMIKPKIKEDWFTLMVMFMEVTGMMIKLTGT